MSTAAMATGAGDAGLDHFDGAEAGTGLVLDDIGSMRTGAGEVEIDLASRIPPPEVTSGFSAVFLRQKDHFGLASSPVDVDSTGSASGSPSRERLVQLSRLSGMLSFWRALLANGALSKEVSGVGLGRARAYRYRSIVSIEDRTGGYVLISGGMVDSDRNASNLSSALCDVGVTYVSSSRFRKALLYASSSSSGKSASW